MKGRKTIKEKRINKRKKEQNRTEQSQDSSLQDSSQFWPFTIMLMFRWSPLARQLPNLPGPLIIL